MMNANDDHFTEEDFKCDDLDDFESELEESFRSRGRAKMSTSSRAMTRKDRNSVVGQRGNITSSLDTHSAGRRKDRSPSPYSRKTPRISETTNDDAEKEITPTRQVDPKDKLEIFLKDSLGEYSRQRLRAVHMSLRRYSNVEARISQKDLQLAFQENQVKLSNRLFQMMFDIFEDHIGVDYELLYKCLTAAHDKTGRDSVKARRLRNDLSAQCDVSIEKQDTEFLRRIEEMLIKDRVFFDIEVLRKDFQSRDSTRTGKISKECMMLICNDRTPLYGALLKNLVKRCDVDKKDQVSWPEFLNFLEKSQQRAWLKDPELAELPEKARQAVQAAMNSNPIEELSTGARSRVVSKFLRRREKSTLSNSDKIVPTKEKSDLEKEHSNLSLKSTDNGNNSNNATDHSLKTSKKKLADIDQVPVIEVENASENSNTAENQSKPDETGADVNPTAIAICVTCDVTADPASEKSPETSNSKIKSSETNKTESETKRKEKDKSNDSKSESSESSAKDSNKSNGKDKPADNKRPVTKNTTTEKKQDQKEQTKPKEEKQEVESDTELEPELTSPNDVFVNIHEKNFRIFRPSSYEDKSLPIDPPRERLQLDWIYGYRGHDCRMNIHVLANQEIAYFISNAVILYNKAAHTQRHYREHTEDIKCMAVHSNGNIIATGQCASKDSSQTITANVRIWRADTLQTMYTVGSGMFTKAVTSLAFPKDTDLVAAVDQSQEKRLTVWDVTDGKLVADTTINIDVVCAIGFNTVTTNMLVTVGKEHIGWWKVYAETHTIQKYAKPDYESYLRARFVICQTHTERGDLITGDSNGTVYIWAGGGNKITNFVKHGHECPVFTLLYYHHHLLTGGRDGTLQCWQWSKNMDNAGSLELPKSEGGVRMLQSYKELLLIGTTMNSVLSLSLAQKGSPLDEAELDILPITQGHYDDVRGLQKIPDSFIGSDFLTAGVDGVICKFSTENHQPIWKIVMKGSTFLCVDCSFDAKLLALGTHDGHLILLELNPDDLTVTEAFNMKLTKERLDSIKLSPDCLSVAVGGHDKSIYIFSLVEREEVGKVWEMQGKCKGHRGYVNAIDWSKDKHNEEYFLKSSSSSFDQRFWNVTKLEAVQGSVCVDVEWASDKCIIDHKLTGLWGSKQGKEGTIHTVSLNPSKTVVAIGDSNGNLSLFRYPCSKTGVFSHTYRCHHAVYSTCFNPTGNYVITVGGKDSCVMQWKIV